MTPPAPRDLITAFRAQCLGALIEIRDLQNRCVLAKPKRMTTAEVQTIFDAADVRIEFLFANLEPVLDWLAALSNGDQELGQLGDLIAIEAHAAQTKLATESALMDRLCDRLPTLLEREICERVEDTLKDDLGHTMAAWLRQELKPDEPEGDEKAVTGAANPRHF